MPEYLMAAAFVLNVLAFLGVVYLLPSIQVTSKVAAVMGALIVSVLCAPLFFVLLVMTMGVGLSWLPMLVLGSLYIVGSTLFFVMVIKFLPGLDAAGYSPMVRSGLIYALISLAIALARLFLNTGE